MRRSIVLLLHILKNIINYDLAEGLRREMLGLMATRRILASRLMAAGMGSSRLCWDHDEG